MAPFVVLSLGTFAVVLMFLMVFGGVYAYRREQLRRGFEVKIPSEARCPDAGDEEDH